MRAYSTVIEKETQRVQKNTYDVQRYEKLMKKQTAALVQHRKEFDEKNEVSCSVNTHMRM